MKKIINVFLALVAIVTLAGCFAVNEVTSIEFTTAPAASYVKDTEVKAEDFSVIISFQNGNPLTLKLNDARLTVTGLDGALLDTKTPGRKTINISYQGFNASVSYEVEDNVALTSWADARDTSITTLASFETHQIATAAELAQFAFLANATPAETAGKVFTFAAEAVIDLGAHQWVPIVDFQGTINGELATIKGLKMTDETNDYANKGLIANTLGTAVIKDLTFDDVFINSVTDGLNETNKNFAAVVGNAEGVTTIDNVIVQNTTIVGHGRIAALVGQTNNIVTITDSKSLNNNFTAVNGYAAKSADGNGDKVAGLVGQAQKEIAINNSEVNGVTINGTRDLGGLIGYASSKTTLANNKVEDTIIQASVPGGMLPTKGTRSIGVFVGTIAGSTAATELVLGTANTFVDVTMLANTLYEEITVTGVLFGGLRASAGAVKNIVIGDKTYQLASLVSPNEENIAAYAVEVELVSAYLLKVYNGEAAVIPAELVNVELTEVTK